MAKGAQSPASVKPHETITKRSVAKEAAPHTAITTSQIPTDQNARPEEVLVKLTEAGLLNSIVKWLRETVTMDFARGVCNAARSQLSNQPFIREVGTLLNRHND